MSIKNLPILFIDFVNFINFVNFVNFLFLFSIVVKMAREPSLRLLRTRFPDLAREIEDRHQFRRRAMLLYNEDLRIRQNRSRRQIRAQPRQVSLILKNRPEYILLVKKIHLSILKLKNENRGVS
jgi:hypothetical protein